MTPDEILGESGLLFFLMKQVKHPITLLNGRIYLPLSTRHSVIQHQHNEALRTNSELITKMIRSHHSILSDIELIDDDMGIYDDLDPPESNL